MAKRPAFDPKDFKGTRGPEKSYSQEQNDAARKQAAGRTPPRTSPELQTFAHDRLMDNLAHAVVGRYETKGRSPVHILSDSQFAEHKATGTWTGAPSLEEYGPQHAVPEDKEYTP